MLYNALAPLLPVLLMLCLGMCLAARFGSAAIAQFRGRQTEDLTLPGLVPGLGGFLLPSTRWSLHSCLGLRKDGRDDLELFDSGATNGFLQV